MSSRMPTPETREATSLTNVLLTTIDTLQLREIATQKTSANSVSQYKTTNLEDIYR